MLMIINFFFLALSLNPLLQANKRHKIGFIGLEDGFKYGKGTCSNL